MNVLRCKIFGVGMVCCFFSLITCMYNACYNGPDPYCGLESFHGTDK